jgi:outer membrane protein assembly factor BamD
MRCFRPLLCCLVAASMAVPPLAQAGLVWRPGEGWSDESGSDISASSSRDQLEMAHKLEAQGQRDDALKAYKSLLRRWPLSFFAPEAQFRMAKIEEDEADFLAAFNSFQKMIQKYPNSNYFEEALGEQYRIANLYLAGEPQRIWKIPVGPSMEKTVELYTRIIKNAPYGTYAPQCQFNIGLAREQQRKYTDAVDAYQRVIDNYPATAVASNAQYQIGYTWMTSSINGDYDQGAAKKAVDAFQDFLVRYPGSDKAAQAQENIQRLAQKQTQGAFDVAKFYETQHTPDGNRAAFIYYNEVVREDPNSAQAQQAKKRIQELRPVIEAMPGGLGPDGSGNLAGTQTVASGPHAPAPVQQEAPIPATDTGSAGPLPSSPSSGSPMPPEPVTVDPNAPLTGSTPGAAAESAATPAPMPAASAPPDSANVPGGAPTPATPPAPSDSAPASTDTPAPTPPIPPAPSDPAPTPAGTSAPTTNAAPSAPAPATPDNKGPLPQ